MNPANWLYVKIFLTAAAITAILVPFMRKVAVVAGAVDRPSPFQAVAALLP